MRVIFDSLCHLPPMADRLPWLTKYLPQPVGDAVAPEVPDKPSVLIRYALFCLGRAEASPDHVIDMSVWFNPNPRDGKTAVCLGGAVMAFGLGVRKSAETAVILNSPGHPVRDRMLALDWLRRGDVSDAFLHLNLDRTKGSRFNRAILSHDGKGGKAFHRDMNRLAGDLEAAGY